MSRDKNQMWAVREPKGKVHYGQARKCRRIALLDFVGVQGKRVKWRWYYNRKFRCVKVYAYTEPRNDCKQCLFTPKHPRKEQDGQG